ncbi:MAG: molybdate ABC transporter substrate-binding protein [Novosphingobium sp.]
MVLRIPAKILAALGVLLFSVAPSFAQSAGPLVLAAASLQESLNAAADRWAAKGHPRPVLSFAASSALGRQVEAGAKADLFISADEEWMNYLAGKNLLKQGTRVSFLTNSLVLVALASSKTTITIRRGFPIAQALGNGRLAMADPASVPAGKYGKEALTNLGVWPSVSGKIARGENVRAALALVSRGEAPLGIVYATDAKAEKAVNVAGVFPASSHTPITYPVATLRASTHRHAEGFRRFLISAEGKAVFRTFGFGAR